MDSYIKSINDAGYNVDEYNMLQSSSSNTVLYFKSADNEYISKIKKNTEEPYEKSVLKNINLKYTDKINLDDHIIADGDSYLIYPYVESELVRWENNQAVKKFIQNLADVMYSFHTIDRDSLQVAKHKPVRFQDKYLEYTINYAKDGGIINDYEDIIYDIVGDIEDIFKKEEDMSIAHGDIYMQNLIPESNGNIKYVIDLESTRYGDILYDFGKMFSCIIRLYSSLSNYTVDELYNMFYDSYKGEITERQKQGILLHDALYTIKAYGKHSKRNTMYKPWESYSLTGDGLERYDEMSKNVKDWYHSV